METTVTLTNSEGNTVRATVQQIPMYLKKGYRSEASIAEPDPAPAPKRTRKTKTADTGPETKD